MSARAVAWLVLLACALAAWLALSLGSTGLRSGWPWTDPVLALRAPRVVLAGLVGGSLALAGAGMQVLLRNELADPYVLGLSGGASAGAVTSLALLPGLPAGIGATLGASCAALIVLALVRGPFDPVRMLLAGVAVSAVLTSATGLVLVLAPGEHLLRSATFWMFGGLGTPRWSALALPALAIGAVLPWMIARAERLDRLSLGADLAHALGVDVQRMRRAVLCACVALTAIAVAVGGLVGFVGLLVPHAARRLVGAGHRGLLPVAAAGGALLLILADTVARTAFAPREVPVGLLTALLGGPFFVLQLQKVRA